MKTYFLVLCFLILSLPLAFCQENMKTSNSFELSAHQGLIWYTDNDVSTNTTQIQIEFSFCEMFPHLCPIVSMKWLRIAERIDIPPPPPIIIRPWPLPLPPTDPWPVFDFCLLEYGVSNIFTVDMGIQRDISNGFSLGLSAGVGFESVSRNTTTMNEANFTVTTMTNPVFNYGAELTYSVTDRIGVNLNVGMLNSYWGDISVLADDGSSIVIEGNTLTSPNASLGLSVGL